MSYKYDVCHTSISLKTRSKDVNKLAMEVPTYQFALKIVEKNTNLDDVYQQADNYCRTCRTPSPMTCVEQCELWRVKNEFLQLNGFVSEKSHLHMLFNAIKNERRAVIMNLLT